MSDEFRRWKYRAVQAVCRVAATERGEYLTARDFSDLAGWLEFPPDDRHWGQVMLEAQDLGYVWRSVMKTRSSDPGSRGRRVPLWLCL